MSTRPTVPPDAIADRLQEALVGRERAAFANCCALDVHYEDPLTAAPLHGIEQLADHVAQLWVAFPDVEVSQTGARLHDGRYLAMPLRVTGSHRGALGELPASGQDLVVHVVLWCELDPPRERLWRIRAFYDAYAAAVALGVLPERGGLGERALLMLRGFGLRRG